MMTTFMAFMYIATCFVFAGGVIWVSAMQVKMYIDDLKERKGRR